MIIFVILRAVRLQLLYASSSCSYSKSKVFAVKVASVRIRQQLLHSSRLSIHKTLTNVIPLPNKTLGRALDPCANGSW